MPTFDHERDITEIQRNHAFITKLWDKKTGPALRDRLFAAKDLRRLKAELNDHGLVYPNDVQIILVDVENGRTKNFPKALDTNGRWYVIVLPPRPRRSKDKQYCEQIAWTEAAFHASNDGYGM